MAAKPFVYQDPYPLGEDKTRYRKVGVREICLRRFVSQATRSSKSIPRRSPSSRPRRRATSPSCFAGSTTNPWAGSCAIRGIPNDKGVAVAFLRNAEISARFELPVCQDTGTATIVARKGQQVWTGGKDEEALSKGVYKTYTEENLRYSQTVALDMYREVNSGTNLPAQIDIQAVDGGTYKFLFMAKRRRFGNKTSLFQETKALLAPERCCNSWSAR
jgi:fumarate hydratase class I